MSRVVVLATEKPFSAPARDGVVAILKEAGYEVRVLEKYSGRGPLLDALSGASAVVVRSDAVDAEVLAGAPSLELVVRAGAGVDTIDLEAARARNVAVMNTPGQNANAVAELVFGMLLWDARGRFDGKTGTELRGKTLGLHAFGAVGRAVATIAQGLGMTVLGYDPFVPPEQFRALGVDAVGSPEALYERARVVSLHVPATKETRGSIGRALLERMPAGATLVNTARKEVVDEAGLVQVFAGRPDFRYLTDVAPSEAVAAELLERYPRRYYCTPSKMGAQTEEANVNAGLAAARQVVGFFERGDRTHVVNGV